MKGKVSPELSRSQKKRREEEDVEEQEVEEVDNVLSEHTIDEDGDVRLIVTKTGTKCRRSFLVDRRSLCRASPVFRAMLGKQGKFAEAQAQRQDHDDGEGSVFVQDVDLEEDHFTMFKLILDIIHLRGKAVPEAICFKYLYKFALLVDKYDLSKSIGFGPRIWTEKLFRDWERQGHVKWVFITSTFGLKEMLREVVQDLVWDSYEAADESLVSNLSGSLEGNFPQHIVGMFVIGRLHVGELD